MTPAEFIDNPGWADFLPEMHGSAKSRVLPAHEDCSRIDPDAAAGHLHCGGTLGTMEGYEERPGQIDMLRAITRAFNDREHLMIEAGTGVGKSLAYLIPSVLWADTNDTPVVISTATRNLQSQLVGADIPRALTVLGERAADFRTALLKGRSNYLCLRALGEFFASGYWTMSAEEQAEMPHLIEWLKSTPDGDLDFYEGLPRSVLSCPGEECSVRHCPYYSRCFVYRARRRAAEADLIVVNHSLVLAEAMGSGGTILPAYGRLVLDEAHNLEAIATESLSREFSMAELTRLLNRLMRRGKGGKGRVRGMFAAVERQLQRGALDGSASASHLRERLAAGAGITLAIVDTAEAVFSYARKRLLARDGSGRERDIARYRSGWADGELPALHSRFDNAVAEMIKLLHDLRDTLEETSGESGMNFCADLAVQLGAAAESFTAFANDADFVLHAERDTHAYWAENVRREKRRTQLRLVAAPVSVADDMRRFLFELKDSVVLSSATLRVGNDFRYMSKRLGFAVPNAAHVSGAEGETSRYRALIASSPFDYLRQSLVLAPDFLPDPSADAPGYADALAAMLKDLFSATAGRALVLFTSYEMMKQVADHAAAALAESGISLLVQGEGLSREAMTARLKGKGKVALFGAQSFWEGVDVSGEALSCVVIARLPFAQMKDPVVEARAERVERDGGNSFRDYTLPEAVIRFRQGFGRLIRSKRDRGVVVVSDPRIAAKSYGAVFRRSIPTAVHTVTSQDELLQRVNGFLMV